MTKNHFLRKANIALSCGVAFAVVAVVGATVNRVSAQDGWQPPSCENIIDMTSTCDAPWRTDWATNTYLTCKTGSAPDSNWCCEYQARSKYCLAPTGGGGAYIGSLSTYQNSYVTPFTCGGSRAGQCSISPNTGRR